MSLETVIVALVAALAAVTAAVLGTRQAAKIGAASSEKVADKNREAQLTLERAKAALSVRSAERIERIKAEAQRTFERDKDRRQWRREQSAPMVDHLATMAKIGQEAALLEGEPWQEGQTMFVALRRALGRQPTNALLYARSTPALDEALKLLLTRESEWIHLYWEWWNGSEERWPRDPQTQYICIPSLADEPWFEALGRARTQSAVVHRAIEDYIFGPVSEERDILPPEPDSAQRRSGSAAPPSDRKAQANAEVGGHLLEMM